MSFLYRVAASSAPTAIRTDPGRIMRDPSSGSIAPISMATSPAITRRATQSFRLSMDCLPWDEGILLRKEASFKTGFIEMRHFARASFTIEWMLSATSSGASR